MSKSYEDDDIFHLAEGNLAALWDEQPQLMLQWTRKLADAKEEYRRASANLELVEAELKLDIRMHAVKYGLEKVTEDGIKSKMIVNRQYQEALKEEIKAEHKMEVIKAKVTALHQRKAGLEAKVQLMTMGFHSKPKAPQEEYDAMREAQREAAFGRGRRRE